MQLWISLTAGNGEISTAIRLTPKRCVKKVKSVAPRYNFSSLELSTFSDYVHCPRGFEPYYGTCYKLISDTVYANGKTACSEAGGQILMPRTMTDRSALISMSTNTLLTLSHSLTFYALRCIGYASAKSLNYVWVGATDAVVETVWKWDDGTDCMNIPWKLNSKIFVIISNVSLFHIIAETL